MIQGLAYWFLWKDQGDAIEKGRDDLNKQKETFLEKKKLAKDVRTLKTAEQDN